MVFGVINAIITLVFWVNLIQGIHHSFSMEPKSKNIIKFERYMEQYLYVFEDAGKKYHGKIYEFSKKI